MTRAATIRLEGSEDVDHVRLLNQRAFGRPGEAALVDALRAADGAVSLVALVADAVVGHILFTPVAVDGIEPNRSAVGLAPLAVLPEHQRRGIGSQLVRTGLETCRSLGHSLVVVLGDPEYYARFGFVSASARGLAYEHPVPDGAFMVLELRAGAIGRAPGVVRYRPEFANV
jgi:putative acetyltransferase